MWRQLSQASLWGPVAIGLIAAMVIGSAGAIESVSGFSFLSPVWILGIAALAMLLQRFVLDRRAGNRAFDGMADLLIHIHSPANPDSSTRWGAHAVVSYLLALVGCAGIEGAAVELAQSLRMRFRGRSARWFEPQRRTDGASALAAGISAAFGAPFSGIILPLELGLGGRPLSSVISSLVAFLTILALNSWRLPVGFGSIAFDRREWLYFGLAGLGGGVLGIGVIRFIRYSQDSLLDLFQTEAWIRVIGAGALLFMVCLVYREGHVSPPILLREVMAGQHPVGQVLLFALASLFSLALVLSGFGTIGLFWPIFAMGGYLGYALHGTATGFAGAAALWGAVLDAPLTGGILCYELTQNLPLLLPCLLAGAIARAVRARLAGAALIESDLSARGLRLIGGRSAEVLDSILVRDAMVTDFQAIDENEPISAIRARLLMSPYAFLPVVNGQGNYLGLLTADMIRDAWPERMSPSFTSPFHRPAYLAKDLLAQVKPPPEHKGQDAGALLWNDRLSRSAGRFRELPCVAVVSEEKKVKGLLFVHHVRLAYERESARRALHFEDREA